eukprot:3838777-Prymnesium_polylepis.1
MLDLELVPVEVSMQQNLKEVRAPVPTPELPRRSRALCEKLGIEARPPARPNIINAFEYLGLPLPPHTKDLADKMQALETEFEKITIQMGRIQHENGLQPNPAVHLSDQISQVAAEMDMDEDVAATPGAQLKVKLLFDACFPGDQDKINFETSNYLRLYQQHAIQPQLQSLQSAI